MPSQISLPIAIEIAGTAQMQRDQYGCPSSIEFDARPEEVQRALNVLVAAAREGTWLRDELRDMSRRMKTMSDDLYFTAAELDQ